MKAADDRQICNVQRVFLSWSAFRIGGLNRPLASYQHRGSVRYHHDRGMCPNRSDSSVVVSHSDSSSRGCDIALDPLMSIYHRRLFCRFTGNKPGAQETRRTAMSCKLFALIVPLRVPSIDRAVKHQSFVSHFVVWPPE